MGFWYLRTLKKRINNTERSGYLYTQKKNTSIEQGPNEMWRPNRDKNQDLGSKILQSKIKQKWGVLVVKK